MAEKREKAAEQGASEVPLDSELFVDEVPQGDLKPDEPRTDLVRGESDLDATEELSEEDVFSGEDFYEPLADSAAPAVAQSDTEPVDEQIVTGQPLLVSSGRKRFSVIQKVLMVSIVAIAAILLYTLLKYLLCEGCLFVYLLLNRWLRTWHSRYPGNPKNRDLCLHPAPNRCRVHRHNRCL